MKKVFLYGVLLLSLAVVAQKKDLNLPKGNEAFTAKKYAEAEADYRLSQSQKAKNAAAAYNLGNSIYRQDQGTEAKYAFLRTIESTKDRSQKHQAFHNLGNVFMKQKAYTEAVEAYKNALRNNPNDEQTRYNFALAKKMLKDNPPKKDDKKKDDKKDKKDQKKNDKDKKDQDKKDDKKEGDKDKKQDNKDQKDKDKGDKPEEKPKPKAGGISKERLQNLMDAVNNEEKKVQDKVNAKKLKGKPIDTDKDW